MIQQYAFDTDGDKNSVYLHFTVKIPFQMYAQYYSETGRGIYFTRTS